MMFEFRRPDTAFSNEPKPARRQRVKAATHLKFIRALPSCISGSRARIEAAHVRYGDPAYGKRPAGGAEKPDDIWAVPLTAEEHREGEQAQHKYGEREWWALRGIDPLAIASALYAASGDIERGEMIIAEARKRREAT